ncbi:MAG: hypothetical protein EA393_06235 [Bacteroidetes bacterium]|nr:MAG: hypothetical protein EA393_06235 [Bacteroidota bacterium]
MPDQTDNVIEFLVNNRWRSGFEVYLDDCWFFFINKVGKKGKQVGVPGSSPVLIYNQKTGLL